MNVILIVGALVVGVVIGFLFGKVKTAAMAAKYDMASAETERVKADLQAQYERQKNEQREQHEQQKRELQELHVRQLADQQLRFDETLKRVTEQLKTATNEMLKQRQQEFAESSHQNLGQIVNPLRETIAQMKQAMADSTLKQTAMSSEMKANIENMMRQSEAAKQSADELARVFKHKTKLQGDWGETVLDEILTSQGLVNGVHYLTQATMRDAKGNVLKTEEGAMLRPDVIMHLDQRRELIIDSKVSLTAFFDYVNAEGDLAREQALKAHIESVWKHVKELSTKDYSKYIQSPKVKMDYVIMFMPHSGALWTALNAQPDLWRRAMDLNVFIADEQTLFAALKIINLTWTQITQVQQHEKVYQLAEQMIDRVGQFVKKYESLGKALETAQRAYEDGQKKLEPQGQSILNTAAKLVKLGAKQSTKNPLPQLIDIDDIPAIDSPEEAGV